MESKSRKGGKGGKGSIVADIVLAMGSCLFMKLETLIKSLQVLLHATLPHSNSSMGIK